MGRISVRRSSELPQIFSPRLQWDFPIWETRDKINQPHRLGFPKHYVDGGVAVLAKNGAAQLNPGLYAETVYSSVGGLLQSAARVQAKKLIVITGVPAVAKDAYKDGRAVIIGGTGAGLSFPVASNGVSAGGNATDTTEFTIGGTLPMDLDTTSNIVVTTSRYDNLRIGTGAGELAVGFIPVIVPPEEYFWLVREGPIAGRAGEAITGSTAVQVDLKPGTQGRLLLRNEAADVGTQLIASFAQDIDAASGAFMHINARIGG